TIILIVSCFFFFQAEDRIRDFHVTGVQTCALPICRQTLQLYNLQLYRTMKPLIAPSILAADFANLQREVEMLNASQADYIHVDKIGRASCRERVRSDAGGAVVEDAVKWCCLWRN